MMWVFGVRVQDEWEAGSWRIEQERSTQTYGGGWSVGVRKKWK